MANNAPNTTTTMAQPTSSDTELLTEHFGYPPVSLLDDIINSINILAERALNSVEQGLLNAPPATLGFKAQGPAPAPARGRGKQSGAPGHEAAAADPGPPEEQARHEIENGTHQLETLLCASIDRDFDKFELYVMRNILTVRAEDRAWMRLGHYAGLDFSAAAGGEDEDRPSLASVKGLRRRVLASQRLNAVLHAERTRNAALLAELRGIVGKAAATKRESDGLGAGSLGEDNRAKNTEAAKQEAGEAETPPAPLAFLRNKGSLAEGDAERPLETTTAFSLSQLQALRALSTSLRKLMPDLGEGSNGHDGHGAGEAGSEGGSRSWRSERLEYVESATRRHLETVRGLELGKSGEVADGEWQGEGRKIGPGEVESMEKVVALLNRSSASRGDDSAMDET